MRLRNIPGANEAVAASPYCIQNAAEHRGQWHAFFENDQIGRASCRERV